MLGVLALGIHTEGTVNPGLDELALVGQVAQKLISQGKGLK